MSVPWKWSQWRIDYATNHAYAMGVYWEFNNVAQFTINDWIGTPEGAD